MIGGSWEQPVFVKQVVAIPNNYRCGYDAISSFWITSCSLL